MTSKKNVTAASLAAQAMGWIDPVTKAVVPPIHMASTYERDEDNGYRSGRIYARADNPTFDQAEATLAALEIGAKALVFSSGMSAATACFLALAPGDHVVVPKVMYWSLRSWLASFATHWGLSVEFVDADQTDAIAKAVRPGATRLVWLETPSNPMLNLSDIETIAELAHGRGATVCVDNTFATPVWQKPLELGADLVMHSSTKYFGGHSDVMGGAVIARDRGGLSDQLRDYQSTAGNVPSPFDCWLLRRSLTTLSCRVRAQTQTAERLAHFLQRHRGVERVFYPGLESHPGHALARKQMSGFGAMLSFCVRGGRDEAFAVAARLKLFTRATSLGGVESLIEHRKSIEGPQSVTPESLLRVSVGLESVEDLMEDLEGALSG